MVMFDKHAYVNLLYSMNSIQPAQQWNKRLGLEYWLVPGLVSQGIGTFSDGILLVTNNGWVLAGTPLGVAGSAADFPAAAETLWYSSVAAQMASDRGAPTVFAIDTAADHLTSPAIFGDPTHMAVAAEKAGMATLPDVLVFDSWSQFAVIVTASDTTGLGFVEDGGIASVAADALAMYVSDGTSFKLRSGAATSAALMTADTLFHRFRVVIDRINQLCYAFIDNMQTSLGSIAIEADEFPCSFGAGCLTGTGANFVNLGPSRVRYGWNGLGY